MEYFDSVWDSIKDTPEAAAEMKMRSALMTALRHFVKDHEWTQKQAAEFFGVAQPRISDLLRGKISQFGVKVLLEMAQHAGLVMDFVVRPATPEPAEEERRAKGAAMA